MPLYAMAVVAVVTVTFIIMGDINFLAPIVTMPFLLTYACIDFSYFALAQTFDIQEQREERFRIQASSPVYGNQYYGAIQEGNDLDFLFPDRVRHKNLQTPPSTSPQHVPFSQNHTHHGHLPTASVQPATNGTVRSIDDNSDSDKNASEQTVEPTAPIRSAIHQKTKNWYSGFCNRWASLLGVSLIIYIFRI